MKISVLTPTIRPEGLKITQEGLSKQTLTDFEWLVEVGIPGNGHDLNRAYNRMLKRAKGDLIVSLQDFIKVRPDYLERFWDAHVKEPKTFFTSPVGKVDNLAFEPPARWDWRAHKLTPGMQSNTWEIDSGCAPKEALFAVGGFDERLDEWWSFDNVSVGIRADYLGYKFSNLFDNPTLAYDHDAFMEHPFRKDFRPARVKMLFEEYEANPKLPYLT